MGIQTNHRDSAAPAESGAVPVGAFLKPLAMALAGFGLLLGLWAGSIRMGWPLPPLSGRPPAAHGPLMVTGFLGTAKRSPRSA